MRGRSTIPPRRRRLRRRPRPHLRLPRRTPDRMRMRLAIRPRRRLPTQLRTRWRKKNQLPNNLLHASSAHPLPGTVRLETYNTYPSRVGHVPFIERPVEVFCPLKQQLHIRDLCFLCFHRVSSRWTASRRPSRTPSCASSAAPRTGCQPRRPSRRY